MKEDKPTILIVDDEVRSLETLERNLGDDFEIKTATDTSQAQKILEEDWVQIILCDQRMPDMTGVEFLKMVREKWSDVIRIIISGYTDPDDIITGINEAGIYQYITKPWQPDKLILTLKNAVRLFELQRQNELLAIELRLSGKSAEKTLDERKELLRDRYHVDDGIIRTQTSAMNAVCDTLKQVAPYDLSVLVTGESGTGKELVARALHYNSLRWNKPFVVENCGALHDEILESELFGHKRGAFTGAVQDHMGLFQRADGGTIFLDEIGEISPAFQVKLLRVLQEGEIRPLGSDKTIKVDVRVLAATNKDLDEEVHNGHFRKDLYFRLAGVVIGLPPLRARSEDIPLLATHLLQKAIEEHGKSVQGISAEALACMKRYNWPGNVREMQNEIQRMLVMGQENTMLGAELLSPHVLMAAPPEMAQDISLLASMDGTLKERIGKMEANILRETLIRHGWNKSQAAKELGLSRVGLRGKLERYGLEKVEGLDVAPGKKDAG